MGANEYSPVGNEAIETMKKNGCWSDDWSKVLVSDGFDSKRVATTVFKGEVKIGSLKGTILSDGIDKNCGIFSANLNNVVIGDNCLISNVNGWISNVNIEENVLIENIGSIVCNGETTFGNGHEIEVLNEGGGRELKITKDTSAQAAYLTVLYRDKTKLLEKLNKLADVSAQSIKSNKSTIGKNSVIKNSKEIVNVWIGSNATINGAAHLENGTLDSSADAPSLIGHGVVAQDFICQKGSSVKDGAMLAGTLVGEGSKIGKQFSSENSVLFANSEGFHSEICSIFGGPYTVTHHRSTLLIAGLFSFYNAGSGTNQSNHMYKLGPLHQGILERGSKTGSFSYLLWPSKVGAFTAVIGKHYANFDTSIFPFSYITEEKGKSIITPAMNFFTVGTMRDGEKWPARDRRKNSDKLDLINFEVLSPYTVQKIIEGQAVLTKLKDEAERSQEYVSYNGILIKRLLLKTCNRYYTLVLNKYFGDVLLKRVALKKPSNIRDILVYNESGSKEVDEWVDVSGLLCRKARISELEQNIGSISSLTELQGKLKEIYEAYDEDEWNWVLAAYKKLNGKEFVDASNEEIQKFVDEWKKSSLKLVNMVSGDASKEFEGSVKLGFGIDGNGDEDFEAVRGTFEGNSFVKKLKLQTGVVEKQFNEISALIK